MDIKFYDFEFNLLAILPRTSGKGNGYSFLNYKPEFLGHGSFEITYISEKIDKIVTDNRDNLFVVLDDFQGYLTGYRFQGDKHKLYGKHLNGLVNRRLIEPQTVTNETEFETYAKSVVSTYYYDFLTVSTTSVGITDEITHETTDYVQGDEFLQALCEKVGAGYHITADFVNKQLIFNLIKKQKTSLVLSESSLTAYDFDITYDNKDVATYGVYSEIQPDTIEEDENGDNVTVKHENEINVTDNGKKGIYRIDAWLSAETASEADAELKSKKPMFDITASTRRIRWNYDYQIGDIVRMQKDGTTIQKVVSAVTVSVEGSRIETPTLTDYEEDENNG